MAPFASISAFHAALLTCLLPWSESVRFPRPPSLPQPNRKASSNLAEERPLCYPFPIMRVVTHSASETQALARSLATQFGPSPIFVLKGDLGAGKTCFVQGLCTGLGIKAFVSSPTFAIANEYRVPGKRFLHLDLYRLSGPDELDSIGWDDYLESGDPMAIEWPERAGDRIPYSRAVFLKISIGPAENDRTFEIDSAAFPAPSIPSSLNEG